MNIRQLNIRCQDRSEGLSCFIEQICISGTEYQSPISSFPCIGKYIEYKCRDNRGKYTYKEIIFSGKTVSAFTEVMKTLFCSFRECRYPADDIPILRRSVLRNRTQHLRSPSQLLLSFPHSALILRSCLKERYMQQ